MNKEQLDAIANRKTTCHPFGEMVTLSRAERDQLVALAKDAMRWQFVRDHADISLDTPVWFTTDSGQRINVSVFGRDEAERAVDAAMAAEIGNRAVCSCAACRPHSVEMRMILCSTCGNKRCPHATDHRNPCTGSNEPGQPGSAY